MINKKTKEEDLIKIVKGLDITPTMYKNATEKYKSFCRSSRTNKKNSILNYKKWSLSFS